MDFLPTAAVRMDISNVTDAGLLSSDGVEVPVYVDALGADPIVFKMKLIVAPVVNPVP